MKILLVLDQYDGANNGNTMTARRLAENLRARGHEVRVAATGEDSEWKWGFKDYHLPIFDHLVTAQGFVFAVPDKAKMLEAVRWADIVHVLMPFPLEKLAIRTALRENVPCTGAFHVQPENIWFSVNLGNCMPLISFTYWFAKKYSFKYFHYLHCPSHMIEKQLLKHGYKADLRVISNGISTRFEYHKSPTRRKEFEGRFVITMSGRLSHEKRQDVLIEAVRKSRHADRIQLFLAGQGPVRDEYLKQGSTLPNPIMISFLSTDELIQLFGETDLYVHASDAEIEAISCMEAFASGLVPIIANSPRSATPQFALDERSLFKAGDSSDLAAKIDWWIEHDDERRRMEHLYAEEAKEYAIDKCVDRMLDMFADEIRRCGKPLPPERELYGRERSAD